jgi:hypothetical protein
MIFNTTPSLIFIENVSKNATQSSYYTETVLHPASSYLI